MKGKFFGKLNGQSLMEYTIFVGIVIVSLLFMGSFLKRGVQSVVKLTADQLAPQNEAEESAEETEAHLEESYSSSRAEGRKRVEEINPGTEHGWIMYRYGVDARPWRTTTYSNVVMNLGYTNQIAF